MFSILEVRNYPAGLGEFVRKRMSSGDFWNKCIDMKMKIYTAKWEICEMVSRIHLLAAISKIDAKILFKYYQIIGNYYFNNKTE